MVDEPIKEDDYFIYTTNHNKDIKNTRFVLIDILTK